MISDNENSPKRCCHVGMLMGYKFNCGNIHLLNGMPLNRSCYFPHIIFYGGTKARITADQTSYTRCHFENSCILSHIVNYCVTALSSSCNEVDEV